MHRALLIPEILLAIFCRCDLSNVNDYRSVDRDLAALARTCRAFKEPALDILWSELRDPSPLLWCLPEISRIIQFCLQYSQLKTYRPLERAERDILRSYARRVWRIRDCYTRFDWEFVQRTSTDFTPTEPLFPNLRSVYCDLNKETIPLLLLPFPSLIRLEVQVLDPCTLQGPLRSLAETSPNIKKLGIWGPDSTFTYPEIISAIYSWSNLQWLVCPKICLDADNIIYLSRRPGLTELSCTLSSAFLDHTIPSGPLSFSALIYLNLHAISLGLITRLLSWARLPSITDFTVAIESCPSKKDLTSFMAGLQSMGHALQRFSLKQKPDGPDPIIRREPDAPLLDLEDLRPCMAFHNLLYMDLDLQWDVDLPDDKLLTLTSSWPRLKKLVINAGWGWNRPGGITPDGLASLLQMCPSLTLIALAIDTRGYTQSPHRKCRELTQSYDPYQFQIDAVDSVIEQESVEAMATFLSSVVPHVKFHLAWSALGHPDSELYLERWQEVYKKANEALEKRWSAQTK